jgi:hypothetical protein
MAKMVRKPMKVAMSARPLIVSMAHVVFDNQVQTNTCHQEDYRYLPEGHSGAGGDPCDCKRDEEHTVR